VNEWLVVAGAFLAAFVSGAAGFGGALLLLPVLTAVVGPAQAVPLLTVAQMIGNLARAGLGWTQIRWRAVGMFLLGAVPGGLLGAYSFVRLPAGAAGRIIGAVLLVLLVLRRRFLAVQPRGTVWLVAGGGLTGFLSGVAGSAGPLGAAVFHALGLPPVSYVASEAASALGMHAAKFLVYRRFVALPPEFWRLALAMGAAMVLGTWLAKRTLERLSPVRFRQAVTLLLAVLALVLLVRG